MERNKLKANNNSFYGHSHHSHSLQALKYNKKNKKYSVHHSRDTDTKMKSHADENKSKKYRENRTNNQSQTQRKIVDNSIISKNSTTQKQACLGTSITMKNLKIVNHHMISAKNLIHPTSRCNNAGTSALSHRALKELVYHSQLSTKKEPKKISVDVDCSMIQPQTQNSSHANPNKQNRPSNEHIIALQSDNTVVFSQQQQAKPKNQIIQSYSPFQNKNNDYNHQNNFEESLTSPTLNYLQTTNNEQEPEQLTCKLKEFNAQTSNKNNSQHNSVMQSKEIQSWHALLQQNGTSVQPNHTLSKKPEKIFELEQVSSVLESLAFKYPEIYPYWQKILPMQQKITKLKAEVKELESDLIAYQKQSAKFQYQLFEYSREYLSNKRQKQFTQRNNKSMLIDEAERLQEELRLKICSRADFEHIILFNQRVVLTGKQRDRSASYIYRQMFENGCARKFVMIAKKQLGNISQYDSKFFLEYFKKLQQLENAYQKLLKNQSMVSYRGQSSFEPGLEELVEKIQGLVIKIESMKGRIDEKAQQYEDYDNLTQEYNEYIEKHLKKLSDKISVEYKFQQGKSYDFEEMLEQKYQEQFSKFKRISRQRQKIIDELNSLQRKQDNQQLSFDEEEDEGDNEGEQKEGELKQ